MKNLKITLIAAIIAFSPIQKSHAAGIPCIDALGLVQLGLQVYSWYEQYDNMVGEITRLKEEFESWNGVTDGMADMIRDMDKRFYLPATYDDILRLGEDAAFGGAYGHLQENVKWLLEKNKILHDGDISLPVDSQISKLLDNRRKRTAINTTLATEAYDKLNERVYDLNKLIERLGSTEEPKEVADLTARIEAEQTMMANETNKLTAIDEMTEAFWAEENRKVQALVIKSTGFLR